MKDVLLSRRGPLLGAAIYWLAIELSWNFAWHDGTYIAFWLPAGVFLALLIVSEFSWWLPLCCTLVATNIAFDCNHGAHFLYAVGMAGSDLIEACLGALVFRFIFPRSRRVDSLSEFIAFVASTAIGCTAGGLGGAVTNLHFTFATSFGQAWKTWALGDGMAAIVVAPVIYEWILKSNSLREISWRGWLEGVAFASGLGFTIVYLFNGHGGILSPDKSVIIPFLLWAALRFGPRGVALGNLFMTLMIVHFSGHAAHEPVNAGLPLESGVATMQIFLAVCSTIGFVSCFSLAERNRAVTNLKDSEERLRTLTVAANEAIMICEDGRIVDVNDQGLLLFRGRREDIIGRRAIDFVEGEAKPVVASAIDQGKELLLQQRLRRKDGTVFEAETHGKRMRIHGRDLRLTTIRDITGHKRTEQFLVVQARILELIAKGFSRDAVIAQLLEAAKGQAPDFVGFAALKDGAGFRCIGPAGASAEAALALEKFFNTAAGADWFSRLPGSATIENVSLHADWKSVGEAISLQPKICCALPIDGISGEREGVFLFFSENTLAQDSQQRQLLEIFASLGVLVVKRDATQAARDQASSLMRAAFEATADALLVVDTRGRISAYNQNFVALWGLTSEIIESRSDERALQHVIAQLVDPQKFLERVSELYAHPESESSDVLHFKDGRIVERVSRPQRLGDRVVGRMWSFRDVTEQMRSVEAIRLSEERFRSTFESAGTGMALVTLDRKFSRVNAALCEMLGYTPADLLNHAPAEFTHPDDRDQDIPIWRAVLEGKEKVCRYEKRYIHRDGSVVWTHIIGSLLCAADGTPEHFSSQIRDVTELKRLEAAMRENERKLAVARDQAIESSRLKSEFLATMSHEIRTPMNAVIGMTSLLAATKLDEEQSEMAQLVTNAAENLLVIINDILDFSRIEAGFLRIEAVSFDLRQVLSETVSLLATRAKPKGLGLHLNLDALPDESYIGDAGRVRQVLTNLVGNAVKFTDQGKVAIDCELLPSTEREARIRISVSDTGIGIPLEQQGRLFQPFVQVDGSDTRRFGGTGLGLAITRHLVEAMGGKIDFRSQPGSGSTFWFDLNLPRRARAKVAKPKPTLVKRILYVDDDENDRDLISHRIRQCGYEIETAENSASALQKIRSSEKAGFDMILLDWKMPGVDGFELAKQLRSEAGAAQIPIVMLSSIDRPGESLAQASESEIAAFLSKSIDRPKLAQSLHRVFTISESAQNERDRSTSFTQRVISEAPARRLKILVAEDNEINQRVGAIMLERMGHEPVFVSDGQAAIDRLSQENFDVILMDCQMPVLDGYEATKQIRRSAKQANIPIIALTASARHEDKVRCLEAGMSVYVSKPLRLEQLQVAFADCGLLARVDPPVEANGTTS